MVDGASRVSSPKAMAKAVVQGACGGVWAAAFSLVGRLRRSEADLWDSQGGCRALVVAPHPDDEVAGCGGVMLSHLRRGDRVRVVCATDGRRSRALGLAAEEMAAHRRREMESATNELGVELVWLGLAEGAWATGELSRRLGEELNDFQPELVYAPSRIDFHPEHLAVAAELAGALATNRQAAGLTIRVYPSQVPLTTGLCNLVAPVELGDSRLLAGLAAHASQLGSIERCLRHRRYVGLRHRLTGGGEEFWQLAPKAYVRLHQELPPTSGTSSFRGLRYYAVSDPLAYLLGRRQRRWLAWQAESSRI